MSGFSACRLASLLLGYLRVFSGTFWSVVGVLLGRNWGVIGVLFDVMCNVAVVLRVCLKFDTV
jgi:hypothetical protein